MGKNIENSSTMMESHLWHINWCNVILFSLLISFFFHHSSKSYIQTYTSNCLVKDCLEITLILVSTNAWLHVGSILNLFNKSCELMYYSMCCLDLYFGHSVISHFIIWLVLWGGKMNQILCYDWLPEQARWYYLTSSGLLTVSWQK